MENASEDMAASQVSMERQRRAVQYFVFGMFVIVMANGTEVIPDSYDLVGELGYGAAASGWLIGCFLFLECPLCIVMKLCMGFEHSTLKAMSIASFIGLVGNNLLYALCVRPTIMVRVLHSDFRFATLIASRMCAGMCAGTNAGLSLLTLRITPNTEMIWFRTVCSLLTTIDIGLGPTISSLVAWELPPSTVQQHAAAVSYLFAAW